MATTFSDTFESNNLNSWSTTTVGTGSTIATSSSANKNGTYGAQAVTTATTDVNNQSRMSVSFTEPTNLVISVEFWAKFASYSQSGYATATSKALLRLGNDTTTGNNTDSTARALSLVVVGSSTIQAAYRTKSGTDTLFGSTLAMSSTWYRFRCSIDKSQPQPVATVDYSTDGVSFTNLAAVSDSTSGTNGVGSTINFLAMGIVHLNQFEPCNYTINYDDVIVYDQIMVGFGTSLNTVRNRLVI